MLLGIDFGTCNFSAAVMIDGNPRLVKEPVKQNYCFPSSVYLDESGQILVGHFAESKKVKDISRYRSKIKRDLIQDRPYLLGQSGEYEFTAQELITEILKTLKQEAEKITLASDKGEITDVVITIPATYRQNKREAMKQAALNAGFTSVQLIEEPVAAAMHYHAQNPATFQEGHIILIYDLGGGTFDATLIKKLGNGFEVLGQPVGIECCGGTNFDQAIFQHLKANCSEQLQTKLSAKGNSPEKNALLDFCRHIKHQFSGATEAVGQIPIDYQLYELNRDDFNRMINSAVEQTIVCCEDLIKSAGLELQDISKVLMVGGSCRLPFIQESVENRLESSVLLIDEPELAVCQGAVIYSKNTAYSNKKNNETIGGKTSMQNQSTTLNLETTEIRPWFANQLDELAQIIALSEEQGTEKGASGALALSALIEDLNKESNKLKNGKFRFLIIGDFNRGKSTILNAFFEQELLPMGATPT
ncbi:MAG: Hsp70 family protein, partial [Waterburya sp.]